MSIENRKSARIPSRLRCWCEGKNVTLYARIINLSEGGLFVHTSTPLTQGARATVRLRQGGAPEVQTLAKVVWTRDNGVCWPPGMGLQFEPLDERNLERLRQIISHERVRWPDA